MFLNRLTLRLILAFFSCVLLNRIAHADEESEKELQSVLKKWSDSAEKIETIDAKILQWSYINTWNLTEVREGRIYFEKSGNCSFTTSVTDKETQELYKVSNSKLSESTPRHYIWFDNKCSIIDHKKEQINTYGLKRANDARMEVERIEKEGDFFQKLFCLGTCLIDHLASVKNHIPILLENDVHSLQERFEFRLDKSLEDKICISAHPKHDLDKKRFTTVQFLIDRKTDRPFAVQVIHGFGKGHTVIMLKDVCLNEKPADLEDLFHPKLDGYSRYQEK